MRSIIRALRRAHDSEVTVVDLRRGRTWWETRLFILAQWQIGTPPSPPQPGGLRYVTLPWNSAPFYLPPVENESPDPAFALELFLQQELDIGPDGQRQYVTIQRLLELYEPILMTDSVDIAADDGTWAHLLASNPRRYFALTSAGTFKALVPRDSLLAALVVRLVDSGNQSAS